MLAVWQIVSCEAWPITANELVPGPRILAPDRPILKPHLRSPVLTRSTIMGKTRQGNKETKKQAALTPKEKRAAKQAEKLATGVAPLIQR